MKQLAILNPENATDDEMLEFSVRESARAVVIDNDGNVALLHVAKKEYYKLPGGGIEGSEDKISSLLRECKEEIGCDVSVLGELGMITEYRKMYHEKQLSYCYFAKVVGEKGEPQFTDEEKESGFSVMWLPAQDALQTIKDSHANENEGKLYITTRDGIFLEAATGFLKLYV